jgi:hypothetical protein
MDILYKELLDKLSLITIPKKTSTNNRRGFPKHRAMTLGVIRGRFSGKTELSYYSKKYPDIYNLCLQIGKIICPFDFSKIHINHNVECPPHYDDKNTNLSCIVALGDYEGGELIIEGINTNIKYNPIVFDGKKNLHWNLPITRGNKYSLVYF